MKPTEFQFAYGNLNEGQPVLVATIVRQQGSSPRGKGARMVLNRFGIAAGTIGGGQLEENIKKSFDAIIHGQKARLVEFTLSEKEAESLAMICGGSVSILVEPILPEQTELLSVLEKINEFAMQQKPGWLLSQIPQNGRESAVRLAFLTPEGEMFGNLPLEFEVEDGVLKRIQFDSDPSQAYSFPNGLRSAQELFPGGQSYFIEPVGKTYACFIIGAGHVAQKLTPLCKLVGFRTVVIDDRPDYVSEDRFPSADQRILVQDFSDVLPQVPVDADSFIVVVTRGHESDRDVLGQALRSPAAYIGMIGSKRKIAMIFDKLEKEGFPRERIRQVHSPIGLEIGAETPEEIAVSIVAEMIRERAKFK